MSQGGAYLWCQCVAMGTNQASVERKFILHNIGARQPSCIKVPSMPRHVLIRRSNNYSTIFLALVQNTSNWKSKNVSRPEREAACKPDCYANALRMTDVPTRRRSEKLVDIEPLLNGGHELSFYLCALPHTLMRDGCACGKIWFDNFLALEIASYTP